MHPTRRAVLAGLAGGAGAVTLSGSVGLPGGIETVASMLSPRPLRHPDSRPFPDRPAGTPAPHIPVEHVVIVMMENHSFDNYLGMLPRRGNKRADGFSFNRHGHPDAVNRTDKGHKVRAFRMPSYCQMEHEPNQSWDGTHIAVNHGRMNGFVRASGDVAMGYWDEHDIPFYYSLAKTFPLANRWFASTPCQTYPNRRFLMAATAYGLVSSTLPSPSDPPPPNGTIFDRLNSYGISWADYYTDLPQIAIIPTAFEANPDKLKSIADFYVDCAAGTLPNVSFVDPDFGVVDAAGSQAGLPANANSNGQDEENPQNIRYGEQFVSQVVNAVMQSPAWDKTMLLWFYDEHGGYYDHVPPPSAIKPDSIKPNIGPDDVKGGYNTYGVRVPAVVVSPWARKNHVSDVVHDHTSVLAFIERKWNLPAMTYRDANAHWMSSFFDFTTPAFREPPTLAAAPAPVGGRGCSTKDPGH